MPCDFSYSQARQVTFNPYSQRTHGMERRAQRDIIYPREVAETSGQTVGGRPAGCPNSFCGCGASLRVLDPLDLRDTRTERRIPHRM